MKKSLINDVKNYVNYLLLPLDNLYYHHYEHSLSVMERAIYLGTMEWCSEEEIEILAIASLFHDTGFVIQYENNEIFWAKIAKNYLRTILYPEDKIQVIENIILATTPNQKPSNLLEEIIKDADMDNLWRNDFFDINEKLRNEKETIENIKIKDPEWHHASLDLIEWHQFYTPTQIKERNKELQKNTEKLKNNIQK